MQNDISAINVFELLGVDGSEEEKRAFLTELQDAIWEQIVEDELSDNLSDEEVDRVESIIGGDSTTTEQKRAELFQMLGEKIPNLEQVLLDRTNEVKVDLLGERIGGLMNYYAEDEAASAAVDQAQELYEQEKYDEAVTLLNNLKAQQQS